MSLIIDFYAFEKAERPYLEATGCKNKRAFEHIASEGVIALLHALKLTPNEKRAMDYELSCPLVEFESDEEDE